MTRQSNLKSFFIISMFIVLAAVTTFAQSSAFSFQGRLNDGTNPANGRYDLEFKLFTAITGGTQIGSSVARPNTILINGVFSTILDFGAAAFNNNPNGVFIEISVRPNGSTNAFTILGPRQQITAVPFAIRATNAANADNSTNALNAQNAVNATNATNATTATTATNALSLGGVPAAGYAKLDVINPGQLIMDGNVRQSTYSNGLVKAMIYVQQDGAVLRCYNATTNTSTGNCGFDVNRLFNGVYRVDFRFQVADRFVSVTPRSSYGTNTQITVTTGANFTFTSIHINSPTQILINTFVAATPSSNDDVNFMVIVY